MVDATELIEYIKEWSSRISLYKICQVLKMRILSSINKYGRIKILDTLEEIGLTEVSVMAPNIYGGLYLFPMNRFYTAILDEDNKEIEFGGHALLWHPEAYEFNKNIDLFPKYQWYRASEFEEKTVEIDNILENRILHRKPENKADLQNLIYDILTNNGFNVQYNISIRSNIIDLLFSVRSQKRVRQFAVQCIHNPVGRKVDLSQVKRCLQSFAALYRKKFNVAKTVIVSNNNFSKEASVYAEGYCISLFSLTEFFDWIKSIDVEKRNMPLHKTISIDINNSFIIPSEFYTFCSPLDEVFQIYHEGDPFELIRPSNWEAIIASMPETSADQISKMFDELDI
jgi:hypothetical protein